MMIFIDFYSSLWRDNMKKGGQTQLRELRAACHAAEQSDSTANAVAFPSTFLPPDFLSCGRGTTTFDRGVKKKSQKYVKQESELQHVNK